MHLYKAAFNDSGRPPLAPEWSRAMVNGEQLRHIAQPMLTILDRRPANVVPTPGVRLCLLVTACLLHGAHASGDGLVVRS